MAPPVEVFTTRADPGVKRGPEHVDRAADVDERVVGGVLDRLAHVDLRGQVEHHLGPDALEQVAHRVGVADVELRQLGPGGERRLDVLALAGRDVVENRDLVTPLEQGIHEVRADEAGPAGHERAHEARDASGPGAGPLDVSPDRGRDRGCGALAHAAEANRSLGEHEVKLGFEPAQAFVDSLDLTVGQRLEPLSQSP